MYKIDIINNPFDEEAPAWRDDRGRVGVRVEGEETVFWYNMVTPHGTYGILEEMTMYVSKPFNDRNSKCLYSIT